MPRSVPRAVSSWRLFWAGMLGLHLPGIWGAVRCVADTGDPIAILRAAAMTTAALFFSLKCADVPALRMRGGWRTLVVFVLIIILLHTGVIVRLLDDDAIDWHEAALRGLVFVGVLAPAVVLTSVAPCAIRTLRIARTCHPGELSRWWRLTHWAGPVRQAQAALLCAPLRAPPVS